MHSFGSTCHTYVPIWSMPVPFGARTRVVRFKHSRMSKNLLLRFAGRHGTKVTSHFLTYFRYLYLRTEESILHDLCTMFKIVLNTCYFPSDIFCQHHATRTTRATLDRPPHLYFSYPNFHTAQFQNLLSFSVQLRLGTHCPWTCYLVLCHLLNYMYGII